MHQVAIAEVTDDGVTTPAGVLRTLDVGRGDKVAFVAHNNGSIPSCGGKSSSIAAVMCSPLRRRRRPMTMTR